jgi:hypothetical protein
MAKGRLRGDADAGTNSDSRFCQQTRKNVSDADSLWSADQAGINMATGWSAKTKYTGKYQDKGQR